MTYEHERDEANDDKKPKSLVSEVSKSQVAASSLAAVTAFLLSTYIGWAGSIIGVAVGAIISSLAAQIYRHLLTRSAEKLRSIRGLSQPDEPADAARDITMVMPETPDDGTYPAPGHRSALAPAAVIQAAHERERARLTRRVTVLAGLTAVAAVLLFALVVHVMTQGNGIGPRPGRAVVHEAPARTDSTAPAQQQTTKSDVSDQQKDTASSDEKNDSSNAAEKPKTNDTKDGATADKTTATTDATSNKKPDTGSTSSSDKKPTPESGTTTPSTGTTDGSTNKQPAPAVPAN